MVSKTDSPLVILGSGPGIARSVATIFAQKRHGKIALIARRPESLEEERKAVQDAAGVDVTVNTYATDISDISALQDTLSKIEADLGEPEVILFNAARVVQQPILEHPLEEMDLDWKVTTSLPTIHTIPVFLLTSSRSPIQPSMPQRNGPFPSSSNCPKPIARPSQRFSLPTRSSTSIQPPTFSHYP